MTTKECGRFISRRLVVQPGLNTTDAGGCEPTIDAIYEIELWKKLDLGGGTMIWERDPRSRCFKLDWNVRGWTAGEAAHADHGQSLAHGIHVAPHAFCGTMIHFDGNSYVQLTVEPLTYYLGEMGVGLLSPIGDGSEAPDFACSESTSFLPGAIVNESLRNEFVASVPMELQGHSADAVTERVLHDLNEFYQVNELPGGDSPENAPHRLMAAYQRFAPNPYPSVAPTDANDLFSPIGAVDELIQLSGLIVLFDALQALEGVSSGNLLRQTTAAALGEIAVRLTLPHFYANGRNIHFEVEVQSEVMAEATLLCYPQGESEAGIDFGTIKAKKRVVGSDTMIAWELSKMPAPLESAGFRADGLYPVIISHDRNWYSYGDGSSDTLTPVTVPRKPVFEMLVSVYPIQPTPVKEDKLQHLFGNQQQTVTIGYDPDDSSTEPLNGRIRRLIFDPTNGCESCWT